MLSYQHQVDCLAIANTVGSCGGHGGVTNVFEVVSLDAVIGIAALQLEASKLVLEV